MNPRDFVKEYCIRSLVCCFSGGKDSLVATHYVLSELKNINIDKYVLFVDTTVMLPIAITFVKDVARQFGWNLHIIQPEKTFWELAETKGMPFIKRRWCCEWLKLRPIWKFVSQLPPQRGKISGLRKDESASRQRKYNRQVFLDKKDYSWHYAPILDRTEKDVLMYIKEHNLPMPRHYALGIPETCMCGAFSSKREIMALKANFPELFQKFVELEKKFPPNWACFWDGKQLYAKDLAKQKTVEEWTK